jgi:hypothetical protein
MKIKIELEIDTVKDQEEIEELLQMIATLKEQYEKLKQLEVSAR